VNVIHCLRLFISSNSFVRSSLPQSSYPILVIMDLPGQFPGYGFGYYNGFPGAPPMGSFPNYQYPPAMPQSPATSLGTKDPNNAPQFAHNVQAIPTTGHPYHQVYGTDPRQPFSMPGYIPTSPHSSTIPSIPYHVPIQSLNPHQRVAMAEQFAKSSNASGAAVPSNVAGYSPAPEHLTRVSRPQGISSDGLATTYIHYNSPPKQPAPPVKEMAERYSRLHDHRPYRSRGVRKFAGHVSSRWLENVQQIIKYEFRDPDILEEALESPGSGISCVGNSHRVIRNGNTWLAAVGSRVIELVLIDQYYDADVDYGKSPCRPSF
jgi:hypothetical protein